MTINTNRIMYSLVSSAWGSAGFSLHASFASHVSSISRFEKGQPLLLLLLLVVLELLLDCFRHIFAAHYLVHQVHLAVALGDLRAGVKPVICVFLYAELHFVPKVLGFASSKVAVLQCVELQLALLCYLGCSNLRVFLTDLSGGERLLLNLWWFFPVSLGGNSFDRELAVFI